MLRAQRTQENAPQSVSICSTKPLGGFGHQPRQTIPTPFCALLSPVLLPLLFLSLFFRPLSVCLSPASLPLSPSLSGGSVGGRGARVPSFHAPHRGRVRQRTGGHRSLRGGAHSSRQGPRLHVLVPRGSRAGIRAALVSHWSAANRRRTIFTEIGIPACCEGNKKGHFFVCGFPVLYLLHERVLLLSCDIYDKHVLE